LKRILCRVASSFRLVKLVPHIERNDRVGDSRTDEALPAQKFLNSEMSSLATFASIKEAAVAAAGIATNELKCKKHEGRSLLISGLSRSGKSILANILRRNYNYQYLTTDYFLKVFFSIQDDQARNSFKEYFYDDIVKRWQTGLIIEGDDFILKNRRAIAQLDHEIDIAGADKLSRRWDIPFILLGNANITPDAKVKAFRKFSCKHECWTSTLDEDTIYKYASWLIRVSEQLRNVANSQNMHYIELDPRQFDYCIEVASHQVAALAGLMPKTS